MSASHVRLVSGGVLGGFLLDRQIALGGMAEVWSAREPLPGGRERPVALKVVLAEHRREPSFRNMFWDEVMIAQRLLHPNIVRVYDAKEADGHLFQVLELLDGIDVRRLLSALSRQRQRVPLAVALVVGRDVARALDHAHGYRAPDGTAFNIVHRDISPHNVMVTREGAVKVLDFGIARAEERLSRTQTGVVKGKLSYMSPEQALGYGVDGRTDIFATGIVLWEMLAMDRLFKGRTDTETLQRLAEGRVPELRARSPGVPEDVAELIHRMLSVNREARPQTMAEVERHLTRALDAHCSIEESVPSAVSAWVMQFLGPKGPTGGRKTMVLESASNPAEAQPTASGTEPDEPLGPPTETDLVPPTFDDD